MLQRIMGIVVLLVSLTLLIVAPAVARGARSIDDNDTVILHGNKHAQARPDADMGPTNPLMPMERMVLAFRLSPGKQAELEQFNAELQDPASPNYQIWLSPSEFGERFGPSADDIATVTGWLTSHGFTVEEVADGLMWLNFTGTASQVNRAFRTSVHDYFVDGRVHHANATDPSIPKGLADLVAGPVSLHSFPRKPMNSGILPLAPGELQPAFTSGTSHYLSPADFTTIYNVNALYSAGITGVGQSIAIVGRTNPSSTNWSAFRTLMGLPANPPQVIVNGPDPGDLGAGENNEADLDVEWSGAVAKDATIKFVISKSTNTTDGVDLSAQYIVNNNISPVMSVSFGQCEALLGSVENTFYNNLWSQAAAQGISVFVASGDSGVAGCSSGSASTGTGTAVNGLASTPYNVAVGGTQFNEGTGSYWSSTNATGYSSALGYIPEVAWNESGAVSGGSGLWATGGGASSRYAKPSWQVSPGVPADGKRDVPDVSLSASGHDGYLVRTQGALYSIGGTSASSPAFAGLMALIVQKTGQRQGNANVRLYQLANAQFGGAGPAVYNDIRTGSNTVPGVQGFTCSTGFDLATGLGSVNANALVANWSISAAPGFTITASPSSLSALQGGSISTTVTTTATNGFSNAISFSAAGLPAGASAAFSPETVADPGTGSTTLTLTAGSSTPAGSYLVTITGSGGTTNHAVTVTFTVTASPVPTFSLAVNPTALSVQQGRTGAATLTTTVSGGFSSAVTFTASGLPTGATAMFAPTSLAAPGAGSVVLTLAAGSATPVGSYAVTITAAGGGITKTKTITMSVTAGGSSVQLFSDGFESSGWVTAQLVGSGGRWTLTSSGRYPLVAPHGGARLADFNSYTSARGSQTRLYRTSGILIPTTYATVMLKFWIYHNAGYPNANDRIQTQISSNGTSWSNAGQTIARYDGTTGWSQVSINLSAYRGKTVYLGFVGISAHGNDIYLDDVTISAQ